MANVARVVLEQGAAILARFLEGHGFQFEIEAEGKGSGGYYASGVYRKDQLLLELHFRRSLGLVRYHAGAESVSHKAYMTALGVRDRCRYPGYSDDPLDGFRHLLHDLQQFGGAFLRGDTEVLVRAARDEAQEAAAQQTRRTAAYAGDDRRRAEARALFRQKRYAEALALLEAVTHPELLSDAERKMMTLARKKLKKR